MGKIDTSGWKEFRVGELFAQERGKEKAPKQNEPGDCPLIQETNNNNGFDRMVVPTKIIKGNSITVSINYAQNVFYQADDFCASVNIAVLRNSHLNRYNSQFVCSVLRNAHQKFDYTSKISKELLNKEMIMLPVDKTGQPDWAYMESYMANLEIKVVESLTLLQTAKDAEKKKVDTREWGEFHLYDIFSISMGNKFDRSKMCEVDEGINFVGRSALTNGVACAVTSVEDKNGNTVQPYPAGDITIALGSSIGAAFVQDREFYTSQNVCVLHTDDPSITERAKWFVSASITASCGNYEAFTDELNRHIRTDFIIRLPVDKTSQPDWAYMEEYMGKVERKTNDALNFLDRISTRRKIDGV